VDSVKRQTYPVEIIVVSDGSPDNTVEVCKELGVKCIEKPNGGLSSARNAGIKEATGEYIMCLDADDKIVPAAIEEHVKLMDDRTLAQCALMEFGESYQVFTPREGATLTDVMQSNTVFCNAMFTKKAWEEVGGFDESETMRLGFEDWEMWIRILAAGYKLKTSDFIALRYRMHRNNMTKQTTHPNHQKLYRYIYNKHKALYDMHNITITNMN
jgi:glycosyltransferase involved in cell wall biosynthesis